jgi:hypothetical protein
MHKIITAEVLRPTWRYHSQFEPQQMASSEAVPVENEQLQRWEETYCRTQKDWTVCAQNYWHYQHCLSTEEPLETKSEQFRQQYGWARERYEAMGTRDARGRLRFYHHLDTKECLQYWLAFLAHLKSEAHKLQRDQQRLTRCDVFSQKLIPVRGPSQEETERPHYVLRLYHARQFDHTLLCCQLPDALLDASYKHYRVCAVQLESLYDCYGVMQCYFYPC